MHNVRDQRSSAKDAVSAKQSFWACAVGICIAVCVGVGSSRVSLWVDELHTEWTISGSIEEITPRAAAGNQSPAFFVGIRPLYRTLTALGVQPEVALRLPSVLAVAMIIAAIGWCGFYSRWPVEAVWLGCLWLALDWVQLFYTTEARPYATVQLLTLLAWMVIIRLVTDRPNGEQASQGVSSRLAIAWCLLGISSIACHATSLLPILTSWTVATGWIAIYKRKIADVTKWSICGASVAGFFVLWIRTGGLWEKRENWASFAGDSSLANLWSLFPQLPIVLVCAALLMVVATYNRMAGNKSVTASKRAEIMVWSAAFIGPIIAVWLLTRLEIAPLMHRRYVVASLAPLALIAASLTSCFQTRTVRWLVVASILGGMMVTQGTQAELARGRLTPWQRLEGWRQVSEHIEASCESTDAIWCASQLIEGNTKRLPLDDAVDQYLAYPLRGIYAPSKIPQSQIHALINDPQRWADQIFAPATSTDAQMQVWFVYRGIASDLNRRIAVLSAKPQAMRYRISITSAAKSFGSVSVVRLQAVKRSLL